MPHQLDTPAAPTERAMRSYPRVLVGFAAATAWMGLSVGFSWPWLRQSADLVGVVPATLILAWIAWLPAWLVAFLATSLLLDRQPLAPFHSPTDPVTVLVAVRDEGARIGETLSRLAKQDYPGPVTVVLADNGSRDGTAELAAQEARRLGLELRVVQEARPGRSVALNTALITVGTELVVTVHADTIPHATALRALVSRIACAPTDVVAVSGALLVRNSRTNLWTRMQEWEYFLSIAAIKRVQSMYQAPLVAHGAFSVYRCRALRAVGGWPDGGEDIVLTWQLMRNGGRVLYEPRAVAFTTVPDTAGGFGRQRARWARATLAAIRTGPPWRQADPLTRLLAGLELLLPALDLAYTLVWLPGLILALFGVFWVVGPYAVFVLPLAMLVNWLLYADQRRRVFRPLHLRVRRNRTGLLFYVMCYQMVMSPIAVLGYAQELLGTRRA